MLNDINQTGTDEGAMLIDEVIMEMDAIMERKPPRPGIGMPEFMAYYRSVIEQAEKNVLSRMRHASR